MVIVTSNIWTELVAIFLTLLSHFTTAIYLSKVLNPRKESKFYIFKYFVFFAIPYLLCRTNIVLYEYRTIIIGLSILVSPFILSKDKILKKISFIFLLFLFTTLISYLSNYLDICIRFGYSWQEANDLMNNNYEELIKEVSKGWNFFTLNGFQYTTMAFLEITTVLLANKRLKNKVEIFLISLGVFILVTATNLSIFLFVDAYHIAHIIVGSISNIAATFLMLYSYSKLKFYREYYEYLAENKFLKEKETMQLEYYKSMQEKEEEIRKLNHDIKNNIQVMYSLKKTDEKEKLMMKIGEKLSENEIIKYSKIDILNVILNLKRKEAEKKGIEFSIKIKNNLSFMEEIDISNLFSNLLDNAIQNIGDKDKKIELIVYKKINFLVVKCSNTISNNKKKINKGEHHGYGLKIINDIAKKYSGDVSIEKNKNIFEIVVFLAEE